MNLLLLLPEECAGGARYRVDGDRARHLERVLRAGPGDEVRVGLLGRALGRGRVVAVGDGHATLDCEFDAAAPPVPPFTLVLAMPRPKALKRLLPAVASLGLRSIVLMNAARVEKPYFATHLLEPGARRALLFEGMMQGRRVHEPEVVVEPLFRPFVEDRLGALAEGALRLVAHPGARPLAEVEVARDREVVACVGPEGGFVPFELDLLEAQGFAPVSLGDAPLRSDVACVALMAQIDLLRRQARA